MTILHDTVAKIRAIQPGTRRLTVIRIPRTPSTRRSSPWS